MKYIYIDNTQYYMAHLELHHSIYQNHTRCGPRISDNVHEKHSRSTQELTDITVAKDPDRSEINPKDCQMPHPGS